MGNHSVFWSFIDVTCKTVIFIRLLHFSLFFTVRSSSSPRNGTIIAPFGLILFRGFQFYKPNCSRRLFFSVFFQLPANQLKHKLRRDFELFRAVVVSHFVFMKTTEIVSVFHWSRWAVIIIKFAIYSLDFGSSIKSSLPDWEPVCFGNLLEICFPEPFFLLSKDSENLQLCLVGSYETGTYSLRPSVTSLYPKSFLEEFETIRFGSSMNSSTFPLLGLFWITRILSSRKTEWFRMNGLYTFQPFFVPSLTIVDT